MNEEIIFKYFPNLSALQQKQFALLEDLYLDWNEKINVISRKDIDELYLRHVLHSLGIAKLMEFKPGHKVLDVGTGGGFPGIPLAILFPDTDFHLIDSIGKKIVVVDEIAQMLDLENVRAEQIRAEKLKTKFHFVVSRAVTQMPQFVAWVRQKIIKTPLPGQQLANGILYLKGGDLHEELADFPQAVVYAVSDFFEEEFFETKKIVYLPI
ncbi:MAG: 16S rRNA (guanine(527)-N(7))-methyltransferase RsmG [Flavobacteriaceae bacterium]|nr:16S rRNA (guanine(527)-N(7))-methyltransferase RsmG [Flavobacteriaceae bacterium]